MHLYPKTALVRYGGWLPRSKEAYESFFAHLTRRVSAYHQSRSTHIEPVAEFERAINDNPEMVNLFDEMFVQAAPQNYVRNFDFLLHCLDILLLEPPGFIANSSLDFVGTPLCVIFDVLSNTGAAFDLFRRPAFNVAMKRLLDHRGAYLKSPDSAKMLTDQEGGWFSAECLETLTGDDRGDFNTTYVCPKPDEVNRGFASWNDFFTREIYESARMVQHPRRVLQFLEIIQSLSNRILKLHQSVLYHNPHINPPTHKQIKERRTLSSNNL